MTGRIIQLTDCHLFADPLAEIRGVRTRDTFERVLAAVHQHRAETDRLIITGDLTHDEQLATYVLLKERLAEWLPKLRVVPGNHDDRALMRSVFGDRILPRGERNVFVDDVAGWRLIGLDSHVPGKLHGELGAEQLDWLTETLRSALLVPTCLFLHHPPFQVRSAWLDRIGLQDAEALRDVLRRFPQVRAVCCGHIHQELTVIDAGVTYFATPATGMQFRPETETLEVDEAAPGFRQLELGDNGMIRSHVTRFS